LEYVHIKNNFEDVYRPTGYLTAERVAWRKLAQDKVMEMNIRAPEQAGNFLTS
jgi:hypothetical protein